MLAPRTRYWEIPPQSSQTLASEKPAQPSPTPLPVHSRSITRPALLFCGPHRSIAISATPIMTTRKSRMRPSLTQGRPGPIASASRRPGSVGNIRRHSNSHASVNTIETIAIRRLVGSTNQMLAKAIEISSSVYEGSMSSLLIARLRKNALARWKRAAAQAMARLSVIQRTSR